MSKNASPSYEHLFYINGTGISGVRNLDLNYSVSRQPINPLGIGHLQPILADTIQGEVSFTRDVIYQDPILDMTGDHGADGSIIYATDLEQNDGQVIGFTSGYLTNYSVSASINDVPTVQCTFSIFGQLGSGIRNGELDYSGAAPLHILEYINQGSIILDVDQSSTNRITQLTQSFNITRTPIYDLKQKTSQNYYAPTQVITQTPIEMSTSFTVEIDDFDTANMIDNTRSGVYKRISSYIRTPNRATDGLQDEVDDFLLDHNGDILQGLEYATAYQFAPLSGNLISESIKTSIDGLLVVNLEFKNYLK